MTEDAPAARRMAGSTAGLGPGEALLEDGLFGGVGGAGTSEAEEQAAIDAGQIRAGGIRYAATRA